MLAVTVVTNILTSGLVLVVVVVVVLVVVEVEDDVVVVVVEGTTWSVMTSSSFNRLSVVSV